MPIRTHLYYRFPHQAHQRTPERWQTTIPWPVPTCFWRWKHKYNRVSIVIPYTQTNTSILHITTLYNTKVGGMHANKSSNECRVNSSKKGTGWHSMITHLVLVDATGTYWTRNLKIHNMLTIRQKIFWTSRPHLQSPWHHPLLSCTSEEQNFQGILVNSYITSHVTKTPTIRKQERLSAVWQPGLNNIEIWLILHQYKSWKFQFEKKCPKCPKTAFESFT